jgi:hypothetical protein
MNTVDKVYSVSSPEIMAKWQTLLICNETRGASMLAATCQNVQDEQRFNVHSHFLSGNKDFNSPGTTKWLVAIFYFMVMVLVLNLQH